MNDFKLSDFTDKNEFIRKLNGAGETSQSNPYVLTTDGTHSYWAASGGGVSVHTLLDANVHTDTVSGSPSNGNIIVGNGTKWTSQSFETFANTYHAVPLVGHFNSTAFNAWFLANLTAILDDGTFYNDTASVIDDNPSLQSIGLDISTTDIIDAMSTGRPVYIIGEADVQGLNSFRFVFQPNMDIYDDSVPPQHALTFVTSCGYDFIGGAQIMYSPDFDGQGNAGYGLILIPRLTGDDIKTIRNAPTNENGFLKNYEIVPLNSNYHLPVSEYTTVNSATGYTVSNSSIAFGSDTTKYLRQDGVWAVPSGGGGGGSGTMTISDDGLGNISIIFSSSIATISDDGAGHVSITLT